MIDIVGKRIWFLGFSLIIFIVGLISLAIPPNLNLGIDFLSGTGITVSFEKEINTERIQNEFNSLGLNMKYKIKTVKTYYMLVQV